MVDSNKEYFTLSDITPESERFVGLENIGSNQEEISKAEALEAKKQEKIDSLSPEPLDTATDLNPVGMSEPATAIPAEYYEIPQDYPSMSTDESQLISAETYSPVTDQRAEAIADAAVQAQEPTREERVAAIQRVNQEASAEDAGFFDRASNTASGFGATLVSELFVKPADFVGDVTGLYDLGTSEELDKSVNETFGYNPVMVEKAMENIGKQWDIVSDENATTAQRMRAAGNGIIEAFTTPEMLGTSLGALFSWVMPGGILTKGLGVGSKFASKAQQIDRLVDAGKLTRAQGKAQKAKAFTSVPGVSRALASQSGFIVSALGNVNSQYEEFVENNNGVELEGAEKAKWFAGRFAVQMVNQNLDKLVDFSILKNPGLIAGAIPAVKAMTNKEFANVAKTLSKGVAVTAQNMGKEAAQEYAQTTMELFNSRYGSKKFEDADGFIEFLSDERNIDEAGVAALAGAGGAPQFEAAGTILPATILTGSGISKGLGKLGQKVKDAAPEAELPDVDPEVSAEEVAAETAETDKTANRTIRKFAEMFGETEAAMLDVSDDLEDQQVVGTPELAAAMEASDASYSEMIEEIEAAETVIQERQNTDRQTEADELGLRLLRKAKAEASKKVMEADEPPALGSGYSPEDVVEEFLTSKVSVEGNLDITEEEKTLVNTYLQKNGQKPYRFKRVREMLEGKDAGEVYEDSMGTGQNSAPNRRARLKRLVNIPGVNKTRVKQEVEGIRNFLNTQIERRTAYETTRAEIQKDIDAYNKNRNRAGADILPPKGKNIPGTNGKNFINVKKNADGTYKIDDSSQAIMDSIDDTIDHLETTLNRYRKATIRILGDSEAQTNVIDVPAGTQVKASIQKARESDKKFYDDRKPTKAIVDEKTSPTQWQKGGDYALLNESKLASSNTEFSSDDVVLLTTLDFKKGSKASRTLRKAIDAGATIVVDRNLDTKANNKKIKLLAKKYGGGAVNQDKKLVILPRAQAVEVSIENKKKANKKKRETAIKNRLVKATDAMMTAKAEGKKVTKEERAELRKAIEAAKEFFEGENAEKNMRDYARRILGEEAQALEAELEKIMLTDGTSSKAYSEAVGKSSKTAVRIADKKVKAKEQRLAKGGTLVTEWKEAAEESKKGGKPLMEWVKETFGDDARAIGKKMIAESIGKAAEGKPIYTYRKKDSNDFVVTTQLRDVENFSEDGVYQVIEVDPDSYVTVSEPTVLNTLNIEELRLEGEANALFNAFVEEAVDNLKGTIDEVRLGRAKLPFDLIDSPAASLIFDKDNNLNANFAVAVRVALYNFVKNNNYLLSKDFKSEKDIAEILGKHESELSDTAILAMQDKGLLFKTAVDSIGKDIAQLMGLKAKQNAEVDYQLYNALIAEFGQIALLTGIQENEGMLKMSDMPSKKFAEDVLGKKSIDITGSESKVNFIEIKDQEKVDEATFIIDVINNTLPGMDVRRKEPSFRKLKDDEKKAATKKIKKERLGMNPATESKQAMEELMDTEMVADMPLLRFVINENNKMRIMKLLGYVDLESEAFKKLSYKEKQIQASRNRGLERNMENLEWLNKSVDEGANKVSMWFKYFFSKNGRFFVDSNIINPQTNKHLDRFLVQPKEHNNTYKRVGNKFMVGNKDVTFLVQYALAQGFGFATDKKSASDISNFADKILKTLTTKEKVNEAREAFLNEGEVESLGIEIEHLGHALQAFDFLDKMIDNPAGFESAITAEFDAVTSGFALKLLQMPIIGKKLYDWLGKVGIFRKDDENLNSLGDENLSMNNMLSQKNFLDSYQFLASSIKAVSYETLQKNANGNALIGAKEGFPKDLWNAVSKILPTVDPEGGISSDLRFLFKFPFMTFNYASSVKSIRGRLKVTMQDEIAKKIAKIDLDNVKEKEQVIVDMLKVFAESDDIKVLKKLQEDVRTEDLKFVKVKKGNTLGEYLDVMIDASYGVQVENVLNQEFAPFVEAQEAINNSFKAMFEVFQAAFEEKLGEARKDGPVSSQKEKEIYESLKNQMPAIKGPLSNMEEDFNSEGGIGVYATETASPYGIYAGRKAAITKLSKGMEKELGAATVRTSHMIKALGAAVSAGSVIPIHYIDGAVMGTTVLGMKGGMTSIHDAIMPNLLKMGEVQEQYNKATVTVSTKYSFVNEIVKAMDRTIENTEMFSEEGPTVYQKRKVKVSDGVTINAASFLIAARNTMAAIANNVNTERKKLFDDLNKGSHVMHMAGTAEGVFNVNEDNQLEYQEIDMYEEIKDNSTHKTVDDTTEQDLNDLGKNICT